MTAKERENFQRQSILVVNHIKDGLADLLKLDINTHYSSFEDFINQHQHKLYHLCFNRIPCCQCTSPFTAHPNRILHPTQLKLLFDINGPKHNAHRSGSCCSLAKSGVSFDILDVTLARCLLINFCHHTPGSPLRKAIDILVEIRNEVYGHATQARITDADYALYWNKTEKALLEISQFCGNETETKQKLDDLKLRSLDETRLLDYHNRILEEIRQDNDVREYMSAQMETQTTTLKEIKVAMTDTHDLVMQRFQSENAEKRSKYIKIAQVMIDGHTTEGTYVTTNGLQEALTSLHERGVVMLSGPPGSGKTRTAKELLCQYHSSGYICLCPKYVSEIPDIVKAEEKCMVLCDDIFGKTNSNYNEDNHSGPLDVLYGYVKKGNFKVVMTMRESIKKTCTSLFLRNTLFKESPIVELSSTFQMSEVEKKECLLKYCTHNGIIVTDDSHCNSSDDVSYINAGIINQIINLNQTPLLGFPEACVLFTSNKNFFRQGVSFFEHANEILCNTIEDMRKQGVTHNRNDMVDYTLLVYVLLNNGVDFNTINYNDVNEVCRSIYSDHKNLVTPYEVNDSINRLKGRYLKENDTCCMTFQHRAIFESVLLSYKDADMANVIKLMDLDFIVEMVRPEGYVSEECEIFLTLTKTVYKAFANHIIKLLMQSRRPFSFMQKLLHSTFIKETGVQFLVIMMDIFYEHFKYLNVKLYIDWIHVTPSNHPYFASNPFENPDCYYIYSYFDLATSCLLFCCNTDHLNVFKNYVSNGTDILMTYSFFLSLINLDKPRAKLFWDLIIKWHFSLDNYVGMLFLYNITLIINPPVLRMTINVIDHSTTKGKYIMNGIIRNILDIHEEVISVLLETCDHSFEYANQMMMTACKRSNMQLVQLLLKEFNHDCFDVQAAMNAAFRSENVNIIQILIKTFDCSLLYAKTAFNIICKSNDKEVLITLKLLLDTIDHGLFDATEALNSACEFPNSETIHVVNLLLDTFNHSLFDEKKALNNACKFVNSEAVQVVKLLIKTFDYSVYDPNEALLNICSTGNSEAVHVVKVLFDTFDHGLFDASETLTQYCMSLHGIPLQVVKLLLDTFDHSLFDARKAFNNFCGRKNKNTLQVLNLLLDTFDHDLFDPKEALNISCIIWHDDLQVIKLLLDTFDHRLFDARVALNISCGYMHGNPLQVLKLLLDTFDHSVFDAREAFNIACGYSHKNILQVLKLLLDTFDHSFFDAREALNISCGSRHGNPLQVLKLLLNTFRHSLFDAREALNNTCKSSVEWDVVKLLFGTFDACLFDAREAFNSACKNSYDYQVVVCFLEMLNHDLLNFKKAIKMAFLSRRLNTANVLLQSIGHDLFDAKEVLLSLSGDYADPQVNLKTIELLLENIGQRQLGTFMNEIYFSCGYRSLEITRILFQSRDCGIFNASAALVTACRYDQIDVITFLLEKFKDHSLFDVKTALNVACYSRAFTSIKLLISTFDHTLFNVNSALHLTLISQYHQPNFTVYHRFWYGFHHDFVEQIANLLDQFDNDLFNITTILCSACQQNNKQLVDLFLRKFDLSRCDVKPIIKFVCSSGNLELTKSLYGKIGRNRLNFGTALNSACKSDNVIVVRWLLQTFEHDYFDFKAALYSACECGGVASVKIVMEHLDINMFDGNHAMNLACQSKSGLPIVMLLLSKFGQSAFDMNMAMYFAYKGGNSVLMIFLLGNVNQNVFNARAVFNLSCQMGNLKILKFAIENFDNVLFDLKTAFSLACKSGSSQSVKLMLETFDNSLFNINLAMKSACHCGNESTVELLLQKFHASVFDVHASVSIACKLGKSQIVKSFFQKFDPHMFDAKILLNIACSSGKLEIVKLLLEKFDKSLFDLKTSMNLVCACHPTLYFLSFRHSETLEIAKLFLQTFDNALFDAKVAFQKACQKGHYEIVELLLETFDHSLFNVQKAMNSLFKNSHRQNEPSVKLLLANFDLEVFDIKAMVKNAFEYWKPSELRFLLNTFHLSVFDIKKCFDSACKSSHTESAVLLIERFDLSRFDAEAALNIACRYRRYETVFFLLQIFDHSLFNTKTALNFACRSGNVQILEILLSTFDHSNFNEKAAMNAACRSGSKDVIELLSTTFDHSLFDIVYALKTTCKSGKVNALKVLLGSTDFSMVDSTMLMCEGCISRNPNIINLLLQKLDLKSVNVQSVLMAAIHSRSGKIIRALLNTFDHVLIGVNVILSESFKFCSEKTTLSMLRILDRRLIDANFILHVSCTSGYPKVVQWLLQTFDYDVFSAIAISNALFQFDYKYTQRNISKEEWTRGRNKSIRLLLEHFRHNVFNIRLKSTEISTPSNASVDDDID